MNSDIVNLVSWGSWARTSEPLHWLCGAGHEIRHTREYFFDCRQRFREERHVVLQLTVSGEGYYERGGRKQRVTPGMAIVDIIPGNFRYGYPPDGQAPYELLFVSLRGQQAFRWSERITRKFGHVVDLGAGNTLATQMKSFVHQIRNSPRRDRYLVSAQLYQMLMTMLSVLNQARAEAAPLVRKAMETIESRAKDSAFNVSTLAGELNCSREYLSRQFHGGTGVAVLDYLTQHRLRLAAHELRSTNDKLDQVALRCGFGGANYLCRVFRKEYGITPMQYRHRPWAQIW